MHPIDKTFGGVHTGTVHCAGPEHLLVRFRNYRPRQSLPKLQATSAVEESLLQSMSWPQAVPFVKVRRAVCKGQLMCSSACHAIEQCRPRQPQRKAYCETVFATPSVEGNFCAAVFATTPSAEESLFCSQAVCKTLFFFLTDLFTASFRRSQCKCR